jgi:hypothetical protein
MEVALRGFFLLWNPTVFRSSSDIRGTGHLHLGHLEDCHLCARDSVQCLPLPRATLMAKVRESLTSLNLWTKIEMKYSIEVQTAQNTIFVMIKNSVLASKK